MNPKLLLCAVASAAVLSGCAVHSPYNWNNGPYAEYGFAYDYALSPLAPLSTDDARAVLAQPSGYGSAVFIRRNGVMNYSEPLAPSFNFPGGATLLEGTTPLSPPPSTLPNPLPQ